MAYSFHGRVAAPVTRRVLLFLVVATLGLITAAAGFAAWVLNTEAGAGWVFARAQAALGERLEVGRLAGTITGGLSVERLDYTDDGLALSSASLDFALDPDVLPPALTVRGLTAEGLRVELAATGGEGGPPPAVEDLLSALALPVPVTVTDLLIVDTRVSGADGESPLVVERLELTGRLGEALAVERLAAVVGENRLELEASAGLAPPFALGGRATLETPGRAVAGLLPERAGIEFEGVPASLDLRVSMTGPESRIEGRIANPFAAPEFDLGVTAPSLAFALPEGESVMLRDVDLRLTGELSAWTAEGTTVAVTPWVGPVSARLQVAGDLEGLEAETLELDSPGLAGRVSGRLRWAGGLEAAAEAEIARVDPSPWLPDWPAGEYASGRFRAAVDPSGLDLSTFELELGEARVQASGVVDLASGIVDLDLEWRNVTWPLAAETPQVASREAVLSVTGTPTDWQLDGSVALAAPDVPPGRFTLNGKGGLERFAFAIRDSEVLGGRVTGDLALDLRDGGQWTADLETANLELAPLLPEWPGSLSASLEAEGRLEPLSFDLSVENLSGNVRARPVSAAGWVVFRADELRFDGFRVASGESFVSLDGNWREPGGVVFELAIASLADFMPDASGRVRGGGRVFAAEPWPVVELELTAVEPGYRNWWADSLRLVNVPTGSDHPFSLVVAASDVQLGARRLQSAVATLTGSPAEHQAAFEITNPRGSARGRFAGGLPSPGAPLEGGWTGTLESLRLQATDGPALALREPAALSLSPGVAKLSRSCFDASPGGALCAAGEWAAAGRYRASVDLDALPFDLLRTALGAELEFTQRLDGSLQLEGAPRFAPSGEGRIEISEGVIRNRFDERLTLRTRPGFLSFDLVDGRLLAGEIRLPFSEAAEIAGEFRAADISLGGDSPVSGSLTANVRDVGVGARIVPQIADAAGRLDLSLTVDGTLGSPEFDGRLTLADGRLGWDPLGLRLTDIGIEGRIEEDNRIRIDGAFRAGEGTATIRSSADYLGGEATGFELAITGSDLTLIDLDDLRVVASPDLEVGLRGNALRFDGRVVVPAARLSSVKFVNTGVSESDDVVLVDAGRPRYPLPEDEASPLDWQGSLELVLGDDVVIDVDVAEARLAGTAVYRWNGPAMPVASGAFDVTGRFQAYGQLLEITEGTVRYPGVPANNPQLRVRAEREIFGNSQVRQAGVLVTGTALKPNLEVYTTPATTQDRALTLLATGSDFNYEQGVGAVDVGTYIAPDLYVSYGIGLFDRDNVISVRYDLAQGFGLKVTSGKRAAGVDLSYTIQR